MGSEVGIASDRNGELEVIPKLAQLKVPVHGWTLIRLGILFALWLVASASFNDERQGNGMVILITNNIHPYNLHVAPILSVPSGLPYHFRYRRNWVALDRRPLDDFAGKDGLIVLYLGAGKYIPLRLCKVSRTSDYGDVIFFELRMGPLVNYSDGLFDSYDQLLTEKVYGGENFETLPKLAFDTDKLSPANFKVDSESSVPASRGIWTNTISRLGQIPELKDVAFLRFTLSDGEKEIKPSEIGQQTFGYELTSGRSYKFDVFEYVGGMGPTEQIAEPFDFEMQTDSSLLSPLRAKERIDGAYDRFDLIFRSAQVLTSTQTFVILSSEQKIHNATVPMTYIPLLIRNSLLKGLVARLGTPLCILFFLLPSLARYLGSWLYRTSRVDHVLHIPNIALDNEVIQGIAVIVFVGIIANWDFSSFVATLREKIELK